jgi:hypothetical protein
MRASSYFERIIYFTPKILLAMASFTTLPDNPASARSTFIRLLNLPDETLVLIIGEDDTADDAANVAQQIIEENDNIFRFVNFMRVPDCDFLMNDLQQLSNDNVDLSRVDEYVVMSISPFKNILSEAVTRQRFSNGRGSIVTAIISAIANK